MNNLNTFAEKFKALIIEDLIQYKSLQVLNKV